MKQTIATSNAPAAIGPYSQAIKAGNFLYTAGQIALVPGTSELNNATIDDEVNQIMSNLQAVLQAAGASFSDVVKTTIFVSDLQIYGTVNEIYGTYFKENPPARSTVEVSRLPKDVRVEIDMVAYIP